ncbi:DNA polymerase Y family protein [Corynebacterium lizhenjunii]|uniref:DNA polymerase Y family protein n=1 Tax=Corynebacterium lizhenjunii TaxID=2709394 RepID=A0A7T0PD02_9CORY|nr:DNA polymerase Y family protein [Corynebacterium lizhenjunii]QPK80267.1 DNA polymerase Y family protein [Corynebacterium lizhenjunii]
MRIAALWFPDWPLQAAGAQLSVPGAVVSRHRIAVCNAAARAAGARRGMRLRQAQALCPQLQVFDANPQRDGAVFSQIVESIDDVTASMEVLRPGMAVVDITAAARFHGGEDAVLEMLLDAVARAGLDTQAGAADELPTALLAARAGKVVAPGQSREFLATQPVSSLAAEVALGCDADLVEQLHKLGLRTLGELAALPSAQVATRFGRAGARAWGIASAVPDRRVAPAEVPAQLSVSIQPEEPIERVDAAAFAARQLAAQLHARLAAAGLVCVRLRVRAELSTGQHLERMWRTTQALEEAATADRVRWQLDGWLTQGGGGGIVGLELAPAEVAAPGPGQLWAAGASDEQMRRAVARVQSQLGIDKVVQPRAGGGRGVAERVELTPFGEARDPAPQGSWPGRIPAPLPARLGGGVGHPAARMQLVDAAGQPIIVTAEALLSAAPHAARWGAQNYYVAGWAGPWPVDAPWWDAHSSTGRVARLQLVGQREGEAVQRAWLLQWSQGAWRVEAAYF